MVPKLFLPVAHFHFENCPWPYSQSIAQELDSNFHQSCRELDWNVFFGRKQVISKIKKKQVNSPFTATFCKLSDNVKEYKLAATFQTKMLRGPLQNTSVAFRWAMAHRLKTTALAAPHGSHWSDFFLLSKNLRYPLGGNYPLVKNHCFRLFWLQHCRKRLLKVTNSQHLFENLLVVGNPGKIFPGRKPF